MAFQCQASFHLQVEALGLQGGVLSLQGSPSALGLGWPLRRPGLQGGVLSLQGGDLGLQGLPVRTEVRLRLHRSMSRRCRAAFEEQTHSFSTVTNGSIDVVRY